MAANKKSAALRDVERLAVEWNKKPMELAKALATFHEEAPGSIDRVVKSTGISRRILYHHLAIGQTLGHLNLNPKRLAEIGWRNLAIIAQHVRKGEEAEERDALISDALDLADHTAAELHAILNGKPFKAKPHRIELLQPTPPVKRGPSQRHLDPLQIAAALRWRVFPKAHSIPTMPASG